MFSRESAVARLHAAGRPRADWLVGIEYEQHLLSAEGAPMRYSGPNGVGKLLDRVANAGGWERTYEGDNLIALRRGRATVTLEPGNQIELSGTPARTMPEIADEAASYSRELAEALSDTGYRQVAMGFTPFASVASIEQVPKRRYRIMRDHLGRSGPLAHHMMRGTAAVQANYDWSDEADCIAKVCLATALGPLTTAIFAHSPLSEGQTTGFMSYRGHIWTRTDPARTGMPDAATNFSFERWVDWLIDRPLLFRRDPNGALIEGQGTFREWMASGSPPTWEDWDLHTTSVFPEVRVKRTIEIRGADCVPLPLAVSMCALWRTLLYEPTARDRATELADRFSTEGTIVERFDIACRDGLRGLVGGRTLASWAEDLVDIAEAAIPTSRPDDQRYLQPVARQVERGESPARSLSRAWRKSRDLGRLMALADPDEALCCRPEHRSQVTTPMRLALKGARAIDRVSVLARSALRRIESPAGDDARAALTLLLDRLDSTLNSGLANGLPGDRWTQLRAALQPLEESLDRSASDVSPRQDDWSLVGQVARSALVALESSEA